MLLLQAETLQRHRFNTKNDYSIELFLNTLATCLLTEETYCLDVLIKEFVVKYHDLRYLLLKSLSLILDRMLISLSEKNPTSTHLHNIFSTLVSIELPAGPGEWQGFWLSAGSNSSSNCDSHCARWKLHQRPLQFPQMAQETV